MPKEATLELEEQQDFVLQCWESAYTPTDQLAPAPWAQLHFKHGPSGETFDLVRFPWLREPLDALADYRIVEQLLICPPQVGKSLAAEAGMCYYIAEDPGDLVAYTHTEGLMKQWAEQRIMPHLKKCMPVARLLPTDPKKIRVAEVLFNHMVFEVSPANRTQTQSKTRRIVFCDERWLWDPGIYDNAKRRADSPNYDGRRKIASWSNSGIYEGEVELQWRQSNQKVLFSRCPECKAAAPYKFTEKRCRRVPPSIPGFTIQFAEDAETRPNGVWNIDEVVKTVRLACPACKVQLEDTPRIRAAMRREMHFVPMNPKASISNCAWAVSGVAVYPWASLVKQFINAMMQLDLGDDAALREFIIKGLNEPWSDEVIFDTTANMTGDYSRLDPPWEKTKFLAMTIDVQALAPYFWFVIRAWADTGESRQVRCGSAMTWEELRQIQEEEAVADRFTHCDCTYDSSEVYKRCAQFGWIALRGRPEDYFIHTRGLPAKLMRYFSEPRLVDPAIGTDTSHRRRRAIEFMWADTPVKDILARLFGGKGVYFGVPRDAPAFYMEQMQSEKKSIVETRGTREVRRWVRVGKRPNHLWDCEAMQVVFALIKGPLRFQQEAPPPLPGESPNP